MAFRAICLAGKKLGTMVGVPRCGMLPRVGIYHRPTVRRAAAGRRDQADGKSSSPNSTTHLHC